MCEKTVVFPSLLWDCHMIIQLSLLWQLVSPLRFELGSWEMQSHSVARGWFCKWSQVQGRSPVFVGKVKVTQPLYLQMLLAPDRGVLVWGSPDYSYSLYILLLDSQLWIDVDSASTCLYKSDSISWYYRFADIWYTCILFKDRTSRKNMAFLFCMWTLPGHDNWVRFPCNEMPCQGHLQAVRRDRSSTNGQGPCMTGWQQL